MPDTNKTQKHLTEPEPLRRLASSAELREILPVGRTKFYETIRRDDFPSPVQLSSGGDYLWFLDKVYGWLEERRVDPSQRRARPVRPRPQATDEDGERATVEFRVAGERERRDSQPSRDLPHVQFREVTEEREPAV